MVEIPDAAFETPSAWRGCDLVGSEDWIWHFGAADIAELEAAARSVQSAGKPVESLTRDDFALPRLTETAAGWLDELDRGRGFILLRGLPVERCQVGVRRPRRAPAQATPAAVLGHGAYDLQRLRRASAELPEEAGRQIGCQPHLIGADWPAVVTRIAASNCSIFS